MKATPYAAFGFVVFLCDAPAGSISYTKLSDDGKYITGLYFYIKGLGKASVLETGESLGDRIPGWLNSENINYNASTQGTLKVENPIDSGWVCIPRVANTNGLPTLSSLVMPANTEVILDQGSNIFLVTGELNINDKIFVGPTQIRIRNGEVIASCKERVLALRFL